MTTRHRSIFDGVTRQQIAQLIRFARYGAELKATEIGRSYGQSQGGDFRYLSNRTIDNIERRLGFAPTGIDNHSDSGTLTGRGEAGS